MSDDKKRIPWNKGKKGLQIAWNKGLKFPELSGENNVAWKPKIKKVCKQCEKKFEVCLSLRRIKYCSQKCYWKSLRGMESPMKGKKHTLVTLRRIKLSGTLFRKRHKTWNKNKKYLAICKEKHWNWKGGINSLYEAIRNSFENNEWRRRVFERDNFICQRCGKRGSNLQAHHIRAFSILLQEFLNQYSQFSPIEDKETLIRLAITYEPFWDINNGQTLCKDCHKNIKNYFIKEGVFNG